MIDDDLEHRAHMGRIEINKEDLDDANQLADELKFRANQCIEAAQDKGLPVDDFAVSVVAMSREDLKQKFRSREFGPADFRSLIAMRKALESSV